MLIGIFQRLCVYLVSKNLTLMLVLCHIYVTHLILLVCGPLAMFYHAWCALFMNGSYRL